MSSRPDKVELTEETLFFAMIQLAQQLYTELAHMILMKDVEVSHTTTGYYMRDQAWEKNPCHAKLKIEILMLVSRFNLPLHCVKTLNDKTLYARRNGRLNLPILAEQLK